MFQELFLKSSYYEIVVSSVERRGALNSGRIVRVGTCHSKCARFLTRFWPPNKMLASPVVVFE